MIAAALLAAYTASGAGSIPRPDGIVNGLSGLTRVSNDTYYAVSDSHALLVPLTIELDAKSGRPLSCKASDAVPLASPAGKPDCEGIAWDGAGRQVWVSDEFDGSIRAFDPQTGAFRASLEILDAIKAFRFNRSLEALAIGPSGHELWTCNEEALSAREAFRSRNGRDAASCVSSAKTEDGPRATTEKGTLTRLMRYTRPDAGAPWRLSGMWAYETDTIGGQAFLDKARCGVAGLACLSDGTLVVLERELSVKRKRAVPSFRIRLYAVDVADAADVTAVAALEGFAGKKAAKRFLWGADTRFANYEGVCEGPRLKDGSRTLVLVSDADAGAAARVMSIVLKEKKGK